MKILFEFEWLEWHKWQNSEVNVTVLLEVSFSLWMKWDIARGQLLPTVWINYYCEKYTTGRELLITTTYESGRIVKLSFGTYRTI